MAAAESGDGRLCVIDLPYLGIGWVGNRWVNRFLTYSYCEDRITKINS